MRRIPAHILQRLIVLTAFVALPVGGAALTRPPVIVILDSYHDGFAWSTAERTGLMETLRARFSDIDPTTEFFDTKKFPDLAHMRLFEDLLVRKYAGSHVDLVIALDNPAVNAVLTNPELFPGVPVVFAGYNNYSAAILSDRPLVTGVAEVTDIEGTLRIAMAALPNAKHVEVLADETETGIMSRRIVEEAIPLFKGVLDFSFLPPCSFTEAAAQVAKLPADSFILLGAYVRDSDGKSLPTLESTRLICSAADVPVFGLNMTLLGGGIIGGDLLSGEDHGRRAGELALRVLNGESPSGIPIVTESTARPMFDLTAMSRWKIPVSRLPQGSVVINRPKGILETYGVGIVWIAAVFLAMGLLLAGLSAAILRRRRVERELVRNESYLRAVLDSTSDLILATDSNWIVSACNPAVKQLFGYEQSEIVGRSVDMLHASHAQFRRLCDMAVSVIDSVGAWRGEWEYRGKNGNSVTAETIITALKTTDGRLLGYVRVMRDVRERRRAEEDLRRSEEKFQQAQKMEAVGRLAGGIAHDFNNLLTVIRGYGDLAIERIPEKDPLHADLTEIKRAADRAALLTAQLLAFSRKQIFQPKVFHLHDLVDEMTHMLNRLIGEDIELSTSLAPGVGSVKADPGQIEQVIMNLVLNARDAMPQGGRLSLETGEVDLTEAEARQHPEVLPGRYVSLTVADTGSGMDRETLSHLFEPFFTTKEKGRGTGLGLSSVYGIMKQSGGYVTVTSERGQGSTFTIHLPRVDNEEDAPRLASESAAAGGGNEKILLVEDEDAVRAFVKTALCGRGYDVTDTANPLDALQLINDQFPVDLVVTDIVMPHMNGRDLVARIREARPDVRVLFVSGYAEEANHGGEQLIRKPFGPEEIVRRVRSVLDEE